MSWKATTWASDQITGATITKAVLWKLADNANDEGVCWPSVPLIAKHCECSVRTVQEHLQRLEQLKLIWVERRVSGNVNLPNVYHLRMPGTLDKDGTVVQQAHQGGGAASAPLVQSDEGVVRRGAPGGAATCTTRTVNEPPLEPPLSAPAGAGETDRVGSLRESEPGRWSAFRDAWAEANPDGFPHSDEGSAQVEFIRRTRQVPADTLIAAARLHGAAETKRKRDRKGQGAFYTKLPSTWLKDRGYKGYARQVAEEEAKEAQTALALSRVQSALGSGFVDLLRRRGMPDANIAAMDGMVLESGPPPVLLATSNLQPILLNRHSRELERHFGDGLTVVKATNRRPA